MPTVDIDYESVPLNPTSAAINTLKTGKTFKMPMRRVLPISGARLNKEAYSTSEHTLTSGPIKWYMKLLYEIGRVFVPALVPALVAFLFITIGGDISMIIETKRAFEHFAGGGLLVTYVVLLWATDRVRFTELVVLPNNNVARLKTWWRFFSAAIGVLTSFVVQFLIVNSSSGAEPSWDGQGAYGNHTRPSSKQYNAKSIGDFAPYFFGFVSDGIVLAMSSTGSSMFSMFIKAVVFSADNALDGLGLGPLAGEIEGFSAVSIGAISGACVLAGALVGWLLSKALDTSQYDDDTAAYKVVKNTDGSATAKDKYHPKSKSGDQQITYVEQESFPPQASNSDASEEGDCDTPMNIDMVQPVVQTSNGTSYSSYQRNCIVLILVESFFNASILFGALQLMPNGITPYAILGFVAVWVFIQIGEYYEVDKHNLACFSCLSCCEGVST